MGAPAPEDAVGGAEYGAAGFKEGGGEGDAIAGEDGIGGGLTLDGKESGATAAPAAD